MADFLIALIVALILNMLANLIYSASNPSVTPENPFKSITVWGFLVLALAYFYSGLFQLFPMLGWVDAGMYLGYSLNLPELLHSYGLGVYTYQGSRLSYVLPLFFVHQFLEPLEAQYLLAGFFYITPIVSVIVLGCYYFGRNAALLVAAFLAFNPLFISAVTFGGTDGITIVYQMLTMLCLFSPLALRGNAFVLLLAGCCTALAVASHVFSVIAFAGIYLGYFCLIGINKNLLKHCLYLSGGFFITLAILGAIGMQFGYQFLFLAYSLKIAGQSINGIGANYQLPYKEWILTSTRVLIPIILLFWLLFTVQKIPTEKRRFLYAALIALSLPLLFYIFWDFVIGGVVIQTRSYFVLLLPSCILALFAILSQFDLGSKNNILISVLLIALPSLVIGYFGAEIQQWLDHDRTQIIFFSTLIVSLVLILCIILVTNVTFLKTCLLTMLLLLSSNLAVNADTMKVYLATTGLSYKDAYLGMCHFVAQMKEQGLDKEKLLFWFNRENLTQKLGESSVYSLRFGAITYKLNYFDSITSMYLWDSSLLSAELPELPLETLNQHEFPIRLVILGSDKSDIEKALVKLKESNHEVSNISLLSYDNPQFGWYAQIVEVRASQPPQAAPATETKTQIAPKATGKKVRKTKRN
jgi:hypothetical protein